MALALLGTVLTSAGCAGGWRRPVADSAVLSRQLSLRGVDAAADQRWDEAERWLHQAIETCPANEQARRQYADILWQRGRRAEALGQMEEAVRLSGGDASVMVPLGRMYLEQGYLEQAEREAQAAIAVQPQLAAAWALKGDVLRRQQRLDEALNCYHRALSFQANYADVQLAAAQIYRQQARPRRALATLDAVVGNYPPGQAPRDALALRGLALGDLARHQEAVETLTAAVKQGPATADLYFLLASARFAAGDSSSARLAAQEALRLSPEHPAARQLLAQLDARSGQMAAMGQRRAPAAETQWR